MSRRKILVVEDEKELVRLIEYNFQKEGFQVVSASDGEAGLALFRRERPDIVILDIMLPKLDGLEVCRMIRQASKVPVLFLTAKKSEVDRILGLKLGADDYVTKPFSIGELIARVEAILRRIDPGRAGHSAGPARIGELYLDLDRHEVRVGKHPVALTTRELGVLKHLVEADGKTLSRETLLEMIWGYDRSMDIDTRTVDQHVARLRRKLGAAGKRIVTVKNAGYQLRRG